MASAKPKGGLTKWFKEEWVDIGRKKKGGGHAPCGRKKASTKKKGYPSQCPSAQVSGEPPPNILAYYMYYTYISSLEGNKMWGMQQRMQRQALTR